MDVFWVHTNWVFSERVQKSNERKEKKTCNFDISLNLDFIIDVYSVLWIKSIPLWAISHLTASHSHTHGRSHRHTHAATHTLNCQIQLRIYKFRTTKKKWRRWNERQRLQRRRRRRRRSKIKRNFRIERRKYQSTMAFDLIWWNQTGQTKRTDGWAYLPNRSISEPIRMSGVEPTKSRIVNEFRRCIIRSTSSACITSWLGRRESQPFTFLVNVIRIFVEFFILLLRFTIAIRHKFQVQKSFFHRIVSVNK